MGWKSRYSRNVLSLSRLGKPLLKSHLILTGSAGPILLPPHHRCGSSAQALHTHFTSQCPGEVGCLRDPALLMRGESPWELGEWEIVQFCAQLLNPKVCRFNLSLPQNGRRSKIHQAIFADSHAQTFALEKEFAVTLLADICILYTNK